MKAAFSPDRRFLHDLFTRFDEMVFANLNVHKIETVG